MALLLEPGLQYEDANGDPLSAGTITFYDTNTTTLKAVYSNAALTTSITNPYTLDAGGRMAVNAYATDGERYTIVVKDSVGSTVFTANDVWGIPETNATTALSLADLVAADVPADGSVITVAGTGKGYTWTYDAASTATADGVVIVSPVSGVGRYVLNHNNFLNFALYGETGALGSSSDSTTALDAALTACNTNGIHNLHIPKGAYYLNTEPTEIDFSKTKIAGDGMFATQIYKNFQSTNDWNGAFTVIDGGDGTVIQDLSVIGDSGSNSGANGTGCGIGVYPFTSTGSISFVQLTRVRITTTGFTSGNDRLKYGLYMDGRNAISGAVGLRACSVRDSQFFGAQLGAAYFASLVSNTIGATAFNSAGGTTGLVTVDGNATVPSTGVLLEAGVITDGLSFGYTERVTVNSPNIGGTITLTENSHHVKVITAEYSGTTPTVHADVYKEFELDDANRQSITEYTIASGAITLAEFGRGPHVITVDTESDASSDTLSTINGGYPGMVLVILPNNSARTVLFDQAGNLVVDAAMVATGLTNASDAVTFVQLNSGSWTQIAAPGEAGST